MNKARPKITSFDFPPGRIIARKYAIEKFLGSGTEGEVYKVKETRTGFPRAAKLFFPQANKHDRAATHYARKLERLRDCDIVIQYHHVESITVRRVPITCLVSEYVEGVLLDELIKSFRGRRMPPFEALHLIYNICCGLEKIHARKEFHGDLHPSNIMVKRRGIFFDVKIIDFHSWGRSAAVERREDILSVIHLLHEIVGGRKTYASQPPEVKSVCLGLRRDLIGRKFPTASHLRLHLESFIWH